MMRVLWGFGVARTHLDYYISGSNIQPDISLAGIIFNISLCRIHLGPVKYLFLKGLTRQLKQYLSETQKISPNLDLI